jgi:two-component system chemotaxis response regulator CheY
MQGEIMAKVLIVDDAIVTRLLLEECLTTSGHLVAGFAGTGKDALTAFDRITPDIVILDLGLPDCDGLCLLREMKTKNPDVHIIVYSATHLKGVMDEATAAGAEAYLTKPLVPAKLKEVLKSTIAELPVA